MDRELIVGRVRVIVTTCLLVFACSAGVLQARVLERTIHCEVRENGTVREKVYQRIRIDSLADADRWDIYQVYLDEHIHLPSITVSITAPDGTKRTIPRDEHNREAMRSGTFESGTWHYVDLSPLAIGTVIELAHSRVFEPYFPAHSIVIDRTEPVDKFEMRVVYPGHKFPWRLEDPQEGLSAEETDDGVYLSARDWPALPAVENAPPRGTTLQFTWSETPGWPGVGDWMNSLLDDLPPLPAESYPKTKSAEEDLWQTLESLSKFAQSEIRYVAVEVGIGGYKPSAAPQTIERKWGDCKDKSYLLVEMLRHEGIEAFPVMIEAGEDAALELPFATPHAFNHMIVAVPQVDWMPADAASLSNGYLFIDATQRAGGAHWLSGFTRDREALVVRPEGASVIRTPVGAGDTKETIEGVLHVSASGSASGNIVWTLLGDKAYGWEQWIVGETPDRVDSILQRKLEGLVPGGRWDGIRYGLTESAVPEFRLEATVFLDSLVEGEPEARSLQWAGAARFPEPRTLRDRKRAVLLDPQRVVESWEVNLPAGWCPVRETKNDAKSSSGSFHAEVRQTEQGIHIRRELSITSRRVEGQDIEALREVSVEASKSRRRRLRLRCR